jgi:hypothetical protein
LEKVDRKKTRDQYEERSKVVVVTVEQIRSELDAKTNGLKFAMKNPNVD